MNPLTRNLVVADGQVAITATAVIAGTRDAACRYNLTFSNVGANSETLVLTYSRAGGTQRQLRTVVLETDETFELTGLPINKSDTLYALTTTALCVDYLVSTAPDEAPLCSQVYDATGTAKTNPQVLEQLALALG